MGLTPVRAQRARLRCTISSEGWLSAGRWEGCGEERGCQVGGGPLRKGDKCLSLAGLPPRRQCQEGDEARTLI